MSALQNVDNFVRDGCHAYCSTKSGFYAINLTPGGFSVSIRSGYCDMSTDGGGWTVRFINIVMPTPNVLRQSGNAVGYSLRRLSIYLSLISKEECNIAYSKHMQTCSIGNTEANGWF